MRLYDPVLALTMRERTFRARLRVQVVAGLSAGATVVDVGCGTGTFAIALAAGEPAVDVTGVDGDAEALRRAKAKPGAERVEWRLGLADALPLDDGMTDRVVMSLVLHHLAPATRSAALREAVRILRPGGRLHVADLGRPSDPAMRAAFLLVRLMDGFDRTRDHAAGRLPALLTDAGLAIVEHHDSLRTAWGTLDLLSGVRPTE